MPCCLSFRRVKYRALDIKTSDGYCRQKNCTIRITSILPHHSNKITVTVTNYRPNVVHDDNLKRRNLPCDRGALLDKLQNKSAYAFRSELADDVLTDEHFNSAQLSTLNAYRIIKSRAQSLTIKENAVLSLYELRNIHLNCIQKIDLYPFAVHYSTPSQKSWYKNEFGKKKRSSISIDASGINVESPTVLKKYIFLYVICAHGE